MLLQDGEAGDHGNMLLGGNVGGILLLQGVPKEPVGNCKALTDGGGALATATISPLESGVVSALSGLQRASKHGVNICNSLAVRCWPWGPELVLWLVWALKSFVIISSKVFSTSSSINKYHSGTNLAISSQRIFIDWDPMKGLLLMASLLCKEYDNIMFFVVSLQCFFKKIYSFLASGLGVLGKCWLLHLSAWQCLASYLPWGASFGFS